MKPVCTCVQKFVEDVIAGGYQTSSDETYNQHRGRQAVNLRRIGCQRYQNTGHDEQVLYPVIESCQANVRGQQVARSFGIRR